MSLNKHVCYVMLCYDRTQKADQTMGYRTSRGCHSYEGEWCLMMGNDW